MKLDIKDIEAIAKSRGNRAEGNKMNYWIFGAMIVILAGAFLLSMNTALGFGLCAVGVVGFLYYMSGLSKRQKAYKNRLLQEWKAEQRQSVAKESE